MQGSRLIRIKNVEHDVTRKSASVILATVLAVLCAVSLASCGDECSVDCSDSEASKCCHSDDDCECGMHAEEGGCFFGNKKCVNTNNQCPDFCSGFSADYVIRCIDSLCQRVHR